MEDLNQVCERLRSELEALYAADVWDCERINRIAGDLVHAQRAVTRYAPPRERATHETAKQAPKAVAVPHADPG